MLSRIRKIREGTFYRGLCSCLVCLTLLETATVVAAAKSVKPDRPTAKRISVVHFGAVGDGKTLATKAIQSDINQLAANGGGTVVIPKGVFLSGAIFLKPGVNLFLAKGAVLKGSTNMSNYPLRRIRIQGRFKQHYSSGLINAEGCDGLRITGQGTLDGNGLPTWARFWKLRRAAKDPKNFQNLSILRAQLCIINNSKHVLIDGITFKNSQFWNLHLYRCQNVVVNDVRFEVPNGMKCPSTDGTDIDSCQYVTISGCTYRVDDDCVCLKGSKGPFAMDDTNSPPVKHIRVENCNFERGNGVVTLGSEATRVSDVVVKNCRVHGAIALLCFKLRPDTPQDYEDIHYRNIVLDGTGVVLRVKPWTQYFNLQGQPPPKSIVRNITLSNIRGSYGSFGDILGNPGQTKISDFTLKNINLKLKHQTLVAKNVEGLTLKNVIINGKPFSVKLVKGLSHPGVESQPASSFHAKASRGK